MHFEVSARCLLEPFERSWRSLLLPQGPSIGADGTAGFVRLMSRTLVLYFRNNG